jgi:hypothetical protein
MDMRKEYKVSDLFKRKPKAAKQVALPPIGQTAPQSPVPGYLPPEPDASVWKKEIKLGGLFKRRKASQPKHQLALPAPGDTLPEAPTPPAAVPATAEIPVEATESFEDLTETAPDVAAFEIAEAEPGPAAPRDDEPVHEADMAAPVVEDFDVAAFEEPSATEPAESPPALEPAPASAAEKKSFWKKEMGGKKRPATSPAPAQDGPERRDPTPPPTAGQPSRKERAPKDTGKLPRIPLMKAMNLLPQDEKLPATTVRPVVARAAVAFVAVLLAAGMSFFWWDQRQTLGNRQGEVEDLAAQLAFIEAQKVEEALQENGESALAGEAASRATALSGAISGRLAWDRLLRELSLTLPDDVWFTGFTTSTSAPAVALPVDATAPAVLTQSAPSQITISGYAVTQADVAELLSRLGVIPAFDSVQLQSSARAELGDASVLQFVVLGNLKPPSQVTP